MSPSLYKLLLAAHIIVSVGWLGIVFAKLVLGLRAVTPDAPNVSDALYESMGVVNVAFPPAAIGTVVTGVLLSLGTKWGLLIHYWVATKLALTVGVAQQVTGAGAAPPAEGSSRIRHEPALSERRDNTFSVWRHATSRSLWPTHWLEG